MDKAKVAISLRLPQNLHTVIKQITELDEKSLNDVICDAVKQYIDNRVIVEHFDTVHDKYFIRVEKSFNTCNLTLFSIHSGDEHVVVKNVYPDAIPEIIEKLSGMIELIEEMK